MEVNICISDVGNRLYDGWIQIDNQIFQTENNWINIDLSEGNYHMRPIVKGLRGNCQLVSIPCETNPISLIVTKG